MTSPKTPSVRRVFPLRRAAGVRGWLLAILALLMAPAARSAEPQTLRGHVPAAVARLTPTGQLDATKELNLAVALPLRNQAALTKLLRDLYDPASPSYRKYLTPDEFAASFGPAEQDYQAVIQFAQANGLTVSARHSNRVILDLKGSVANIQKALHVTLRTYQHPTEARQFYAPDSEPSLNLAVPIVHISGLDNYALPKPRVIPKPAGLAAAATPNAGSGPGGAYMGKDFRAAYVPGTALTGTGQTVGLLQFDGYTASDITYYEAQAGLPNVPLNNVLLDGVTGLPSGDGGEVEVSLDIEMSMSMAPGLSQIIVYEGAVWHDILNRMATDNLARQLSCSWYIPGGAADPVADGIFQQMAAQGQSFYSASGDYDAFTGLIPFPGDTPYITEVGGTTLTANTASGPYVSETAWNWGLDGSNYVGTGGGISTQYAIPSWQQGTSMATNQGSTTMRNVPDVALTADNVYVRVDGENDNVGGTSCAAPLWAGFTALVNQQAVANSHPTVGFLNPTLYNLSLGGTYTSNFHDITVGNNFSASSPSKFAAVAGYDLCTGLGTPTATLLSTLGGPFVPTITSFSPASGLANTTVTITGTNFFGVTSVAFHGTSASFTVNSPTQITATVPVGATTGAITAVTPGGTATSPTNFTVFGFSPAYGLPGSPVTLTGSGFTNASAVSFNGVSAISFTVNSDTQITVTVPAAATTGPISVTTPSGNVTGSNSFFVLTGNGAPTITSFTPASGLVGAAVTITGTNFIPGATVSFNGIPAVCTVNSTTQITASVPVPSPSAGLSGLISVTTALGTATSSTAFTTISTLVTYNSATNVPITSNGFTATGLWIFFTLNFAPSPGTNLTVVNNTGLAFINGAFGNLAQGQVVTLSYGGINYNFVANYFGGTGNDLVLQWANNRPLAWGLDNDGQLGNNNPSQFNLPVAMTTAGTALAGKTVKAVSGGYAHSLMLCSDGTLAASGYNTFGQLGNNSVTNSTVPVPVTTAGTPLAGKTIVAVAAGEYHSLALCSDGTLAAWGDNAYGQLGNNSTSNSLVPVAVTTAGTALAGKTVVAIAAGFYHNLAVCSDGTVAAWGYNSTGQLGNNSTTNSSVPVAVTTAGTVLAGKIVVGVAAGYEHSLAVCSDGTLAAWGYNSYGQLGNNSTNNSLVPVAVTTAGTPLAGETVIAVSAGDEHSVALCSNGSVAAWGYNGLGQLGNGTYTSSSVPVAVTTTGTPLTGKTVTAVIAGTFHNVAVCSDGTLAAWGYNYYGQLGNTTTTTTSLPTAVITAGTPLAGRSVIGLGAGAYHSLAVCSDGTVDAWGSDSYGQLGNNILSNFSTPVAVTTAGTPLAGKTLIAQAAGGDHSLALCSDGTLAAWGFNGDGQLGNSTYTNSLVPVAVTTSGVLAGKTVVAISAGQDHSLALCADGTLAAWGYANDGELGNGSTTESNIPVAVTIAGTPLAGKNVIAIAAGGSHNLALCADGTLAAWGSNTYGQLGNNSTTYSDVPVAVTTTGTPLAGKTVIAIAAGFYHSLALCSDGTLAAWGNNGIGQLGNGTFTNSSVPVAVSTAGTPLAGQTVTAIAAGYEHCLVLCSNGTLAAWGYNFQGQLGNGNTNFSTVPTAVTTAGTPLANETIVSVSAGSFHSMALCADGTLAAWGENTDGQVGDNSFSNSLLPVAVSTASLVTGEIFVQAISGQSADHALGVVAEPPFPSVTTVAATSVTTTTATLNGLVSANNNNAAVSFDYGTTLAYGTNVPATPTPITGNTATAVSATLNGLFPGTTYHFRVDGVNAAGTGTGYDLTFTTEDSNATLAGLSLSSGTLTPAFATGTTGYTASVPSSTSSITVTPTTGDTAATVKVNGALVTSGNPSGPINLAEGANTITTVVTASDGVTTMTYTVVVTRTPSSNANLANLALSAGTLSPAFASSTTSYTASVSATTGSVTVTPTTADSGATVTVNGLSVASGSASSPISLVNGGNTTINIVVTAGDGVTTISYTVVVTRAAASTNANLSALALSAGTLTPAFSSSTTSYTASAPYTTTFTTVIPTTADPTATITVNGVTVLSGAASGSINLAVGNNNVSVVVTAQDGVTVKTYTVVVTRTAPSTNANLANLTLSAGTLTPVFATGTTSYTATVPYTTTPITITPTVANGTATVKVNGVTVVSGNPSSAINLAVGPNTISTVVTAQDGVTTDTYTVVVTRTAASTNANLSSLALSTGTLTPVFASGTTSYTESVLYATSSVTVTPTVADSTATVKVNGVTVASGSPSGAISLAVGANTINTVVTAQDGVTTITYSVVITRAPVSTNASLSSLIPSTGTLTPAFATGTTSYTIAVANNVTSMSVTPTVADNTATLAVNGVAIASGSASNPINLVVGNNTIATVVTAQDGVTTKTYSVVITRAPSSNANLANLVLSTGTLSPVFAASTTSYTAGVSSSTTSLTITPTVADSTATVTVNGATVASGSASNAINLVVGTNAVNIVVTAQDGVTTITYAVVVARSTSAGTFINTGPLNVARTSQCGVLLANGKVLIAGGQNGTTTVASAELYDPTTGAWTLTGSLNTARYQATATVLSNGKVLIAGGTGTAGSSLNSAELYDPATGVWTVTGSLTNARAAQTAVLLANGQVLVAGGIVGSNAIGSAELYNPATGTWAVTSPLNAARASATAALLPGGQVLVAGGRTNVSNGLSSSELYNPGTGAWTTTSGAMTAARYYHTMTLLPNGEVLAAGGLKIPSALASAEIFNPALGTWTATGSMNTARDLHSASLLPNGKVLVAGGVGTTTAELYDYTTGLWTATSSLNALHAKQTSTILANGKVLIAGGTVTTTEYYDPAVASWTNTGSLPAACTGHTATLLPSGAVLVAGGTNGTPLATASTYNPATLSWTATAALNTARKYHSATLLPTGKVLVAGGEDGNSDPLATAELYDPIAGTWTFTGALGTARYSHTATLLANGYVLVTGGSGATGYVAAGEIYNPATGAWSTTGALTVARALHTATLLPSGKVLAAGGAGSAGPLNSAELYDPLAATWTTLNPMSYQHAGGAATLLPNGSVLVAGGSGSNGDTTSELYNPATGLWTPTGLLNAGRVFFTTTLLSNGNVLAVGGEDVSSGTYPVVVEAYDPMVSTWNLLPSLSAGLDTQAATLLPDGTVLVTGGYNGTYLSSGQLYHVGQGFNAAWQPQVTTVTSPLLAGGSLVVSGVGMKGLGGASSGTFQDSPTNYPVVQLRALDGSQTAYLLANASTNWSDASFTSAAVNNFPYGYALATVITNGIPSNAALLEIGPVPSAPNANLANLALSAGTLTPAFASTTTSYTATVTAATASLTVTPTVAGSGATLTLNGTPVQSGAASFPIDLSSGANPLTLLVTASDGITTNTYNVVVTQMTQLQTWRWTYFGTMANSGATADTGDYDANGIPNLAKYAFGLDPTQPSSNQIPQPLLNGNAYGISFTEPPGISGITYGAQWTNTLNPPNWQPVSDTGTGTTHIFSISIGTNPNVFMRLQVTSQ